MFSIILSVSSEFSVAKNHNIKESENREGTFFLSKNLHKTSRKFPPWSSCHNGNIIMINL
jgi:hypothetical protein